MTQEGLNGFLKYFNFLDFMKELRKDESLAIAIGRKSAKGGELNYQEKKFLRELYSSSRKVKNTNRKEPRTEKKLNKKRELATKLIPPKLE